MLLFRLSTGAGWNDVLDACSIQPPYCDRNYKDLPRGNCGDPIAAKIYFSILIVVSFLIIINMYIAIILENLYFVSYPFFPDISVSESIISQVSARVSETITEASIDGFYAT